MKNTFVLNGLNITIEGNPVSIEHVELTSDMTVQEIATSGGLIKGLISELKPLIQEATKPVVTPAVTTTAPNNYNSNRNYSNNYNKNNDRNYNNNYKNDNYSNSNKDNTRALNIQSSFDALERPEEYLKEDKYKTWVYESGSYCNGDRIKVNIDNAKLGVLHVNIITAYTQVHIHVYPDKTTWHGTNATTFHELLKHLGMPEELQAYLLKVVAL